MSDTPLSSEVLPSPEILSHVTDVHCHPTDAPSISQSSMQNLQIHICAMSSGTHDQDKVKSLAESLPDKVTPAFGYHPWFSHLISTERSLASDSAKDVNGKSMSDKERHYRHLFLPSSFPNSNPKADPSLESQFEALLPSLPSPTPLSQILSTLRNSFSLFPTAMLGEVGLDRIFRVPIDYFVPPGKPRILTPFQSPLDHQLEILEAQLGLAVELKRNVSFHSVKSQQATVDALNRMKAKYGAQKWNRISVDMHSCGFSTQTWKDLEKKHENVFLSLSTVINSKNSNLRELISSCSPDRILVESDYNDIDMVTTQTFDMLKLVAEVRGWSVETNWTDGAELDEKDWGIVRRLEKNWHRFRDGKHPVKQKKQKKIIDYVSEGSET